MRCSMRNANCVAMRNANCAAMRAIYRLRRSRAALIVLCAACENVHELCYTPESAYLRSNQRWNAVAYAAIYAKPTMQALIELKVF